MPPIAGGNGGDKLSPPLESALQPRRRQAFPSLGMSGLIWIRFVIFIFGLKG